LTKEEIIVAADRGPHKLVLVADAITMTHSDTEEKVREGYVEIVFLDEVEHLLGTEE